MQLKREEFVALEGSKRKAKRMPDCIVRQDSRLQHAVSSLSSSSGSSNHNSSGEDSGMQHHHRATTKQTPPTQPESSAVGDKRSAKEQDENFGDSDTSRMGEECNSYESKRMTTDSSSGEDSARPSPRPAKKFKQDGGSQESSSKKYNLPPNIAKNGGIPHNIQPVAIGNGTARLSMAPAIPLPPFSGIGKKTTVLPGQSNETSPITTQGPAIISADVETTSNTSSNSKRPQIRGSYHMNEDDMILMDDVLMCPFVFRSQDAVLCGALAECTMPGMLRASFSTRNKIQGVEMVYDAMGFMQQLERASGKEGSAHIIPGSLEMVLSPNTTDALIITLAEPPFLIVNVNELWTRMTGYTQMEVEGREYLSLIEGDGTVPEAADRLGRPKHRFDEVANGRSACSTNIHYDKEGKDFIEFVCSYPLTNASNEVTHLLHVCKELPSLTPSTIRAGE
jgi:PAS domain-containing protein